MARVWGCYGSLGQGEVQQRVPGMQHEPARKVVKHQSARQTETARGKRG